MQDHFQPLLLLLPQVANLRRIEMIESAAQGLPTGDQLYRTSSSSSNNKDAAIAAAAAAAAAATIGGPAAGSGAAAVTASTAGGRTADESEPADGLSRTLGSNSIAGSAPDGSAAVSTAGLLPGTSAAARAAGNEVQRLLASVGSCPAAACQAKDLVYSELDVTYPTRKLTQVQLYKRMVWELKTQ